VFTGKRHLDDNALIRRYLADRGLEALESGDEALLRHLAHCPACDARYAALRSTFDDTREARLRRKPWLRARRSGWNASGPDLASDRRALGGPGFCQFPAPAGGPGRAGHPWALAAGSPRLRLQGS